MLLTIMRGLPGSGKSYKAKKLQEERGGVILSADNFFLDSNGNYNWYPEGLYQAHKKCQEDCAFALSRSIPVIIDNTNIKERDVNVYMKIAARLIGTDNVIIEEPDTEWKWDVEECFKRNTHNVPLETIQRMKDTYWKCGT